MIEDRPAWARRMTNEREARSWSQADAVRAMQAHAATDEKLPGRRKPAPPVEAVGIGRGHARRLLQADHRQNVRDRHARDVPVPPKHDAEGDVLAVTGMDTLELVSRLQRSDLDEATLNGLRVMADSLCSEYPFMPSRPAAHRGPRLAAPDHHSHGQRLTLKQHREILVQAGWVTLLLACVEYDTGNRQAAETTRQAALSLGTEADHAEIQGWAQEIRAWMNLTAGDYHGVIAAAQAGTDMAPVHGVTVQLAAQEAKAWARIGDRRQTEVALDRGRRLLDSMPYPENLDNHFVVDPTKFDFYAMDCYRHLAEDRMAETLADEVIRSATDFDGTERAPMRLAEARVTLGVVAARQGDVEQAIHQGEHALERTAQVSTVTGHGQPRPDPCPQAALSGGTSNKVFPR